jgi:hypothetical protein
VQLRESGVTHGSTLGPRHPKTSEEAAVAMTCWMLDELFVPISLGVVGHFLVAAAESWIRRSHRLLKRLCNSKRDETQHIVQFRVSLMHNREDRPHPAAR